MLAGLMWAGLLAAAGGDAPRITERAPLLWHLVAPSRALPEDAEARVLATADRTLRAYTRLQIVTTAARGLNEALLAKCAAQDGFACWVALARPDAVNGGEAEPGAPPFLLVVTVVPSAEQPERFSLALLDLDRAVRAGRIVVRDGGNREALENLIFQDAVHSETALAELADDAAVARLFRTFFAERQSELFRATRAWAPSGTIEIHGEQAGLEVRLDGHAVGTTGAKTFSITDVLEGTRRVELVEPHALVDYPAVTVNVRPGATVTVSSAPRTHSIVPTLRTVTIWSGVAVAATGVAFLSYAAFAPRDRHQVRVCPGGDCTADARSGFATFSDFGTNPEGAASSSGPLVAPLGYSLIAAGATWSAGTLLIGEDWELPWLPVVLGLAVGGASYGVSALAN